MRLLAIDIGTRRTGVAWFDDATGIVMPLETIEHQTEEELISVIQALAKERHTERIVAGMPLLPSGREGSQAKVVLGVIEKLKQSGVDVVVLDERYTSGDAKDPDARAAHTLLQTYLERSKAEGKNDI